MSRSRKKHPIGGIAKARSDKPYKVTEHRRERHYVAQFLRREEEPLPKDFGNPWGAPKDGKRWFAPDDDWKWWRK